MAKYVHEILTRRSLVINDAAYSVQESPSVACASSTKTSTAPLGQTVAQRPQCLHRETSRNILLFSRRMAPINQSCSHVPQALHFSGSDMMWTPASGMIDAAARAGRYFPDWRIVQRQQWQIVRSLPRSRTPPYEVVDLDPAQHGHQALFQCFMRMADCLVDAYLPCNTRIDFPGTFSKQGTAHGNRMMTALLCIAASAVPYNDAMRGSAYQLLNNHRWQRNVFRTGQGFIDRNVGDVEVSI